MPEVIKGNSASDQRGSLRFNNLLNIQGVKRMYVIQNNELNFRRAWQGHKIERRWFCAVHGAFEIQVITIDDWENPTVDLPKKVFKLHDDALDVLCIPSGCVTSIQALQDDSKLLVMSDYEFKEIDDEYRFEGDYFVQ